jgi:predicted acyl esterase
MRAGSSSTVTITLHPTSNLFMPGHRLRLDVSRKSSAGWLGEQPRHPARCEGCGKRQTQRGAGAGGYEDALVEQRGDDAAGLAFAGAHNARSVGARQVAPVEDRLKDVAGFRPASS